MDVKVSIGGEDADMNNSMKEFKKDGGGASMEPLENEMDFLKEEEIRRSQERMNKALAAAQTAKGRNQAETYVAAEGLANIIEGANVEEFIVAIEGLANQTDLFAIFNFPGLSKGSLLHVAAATDKDDIFRLLLDHVNDDLITAQNDWGDTSLHATAKFGGSRAAPMLIHRVRDLLDGEGNNRILRMKNKLGNTALHEAVLNCHVNMVRLLLEEDLEPVYWKNMAEKSPLYLALDTKDSDIHNALFSLSLEPSRIEGLPPVHGAIMRRNFDLVAMVLKKNEKLFAMTDSRGSNIFHLAAHTNIEATSEHLPPEIEYLAGERDMNGDLPIHIAAKMGYVRLIEKLHKISRFLPNGQGQSVLHVAAKYGRASAVKDILRHPELGKQLNSVDHAGNTPLHLAMMYLQPTTLIPLALDERIQLAIPNNKCLTAFDIALHCGIREPPIRKSLASLVLACLCSREVQHGHRDSLILRPEDRDETFKIVSSHEEMPNRDNVKDFVDSHMVVATLVTTVTFAAGFAVPGGFNGSGTATMLDKGMFQAFVICNTVAMFCSMTTVVILITARLYDFDMAKAAIQQSILPLTIALSSMSIAFLTGVTLTVGKLPWLANTVFYLGFVFLLVISRTTLSGYFPVWLNRYRPVVRLTFWLILAYIRLMGIETYIDEDMEDDRTCEQKTSTSRPVDGAGESKTDDSATAKCGDVPHPLGH